MPESRSGNLSEQAGRKGSGQAWSRRKGFLAAGAMVENCLTVGAGVLACSSSGVELWLPKPMQVLGKHVDS